MHSAEADMEPPITQGPHKALRSKLTTSICGANMQPKASSAVQDRQT